MPAGLNLIFQTVYIISQKAQWKIEKFLSLRRIAADKTSSIWPDFTSHYFKKLFFLKANLVFLSPMEWWLKQETMKTNLSMFMTFGFFQL